MSRFYVTTPIYYVSDVPHIGNAYTSIVADALARYHRLRGRPTHFLTGTDEHGEKIERAARERGVAPQAFVDGMSARFREVLAPLHVTPDDFIRTTDPKHAAVVQELWRRCVANGAIYEGTYEGLYCVGCEAYYGEKELEPTPQGLLCKIHLTPVETVREPTWMFALSKFQERLLAFYDRHPQALAPESRRNEVLSFVRSGLLDLSISRTSFSWGIPVPGESRDGVKHVIYVWFDALTNYLSALGPEDGPLHQQFWPPDVHLVGKDILRFHAVYWPAFLMAAGYPDDRLPRKTYAHGWLTINGQKMSKSLRNVVEPVKLAETFGADVVRYYLLREIAFGQDGDFSHAQLIARYNAELADSLGNLLNRTLGLCTKLRPPSAGGAAGEDSFLDASVSRTPLDDRLAETARTALASTVASFEDIAPHRAIDAIWTLCRAANKYVDEAAPWAEAKKGESARSRVDAILASALESVRWISVLLWPAMPEVSGKIRVQLGLPEIRAGVATDHLALEWQTRWPTRGLAAGTPIFPKIDAERQQAIFDELGVTAPPPAQPRIASDKHEKEKAAIAGPAAEVAFDEFSRIDLRVGSVVAAERVPKSDKLLRVQVDLGELGNRQVVAGIGKSFTPEELVGRQVVVVANLKPAKLMGVESRGMLLAVGGEGGEAGLALLAPSRARVNGTRVK